MLYIQRSDAKVKHLCNGKALKSWLRLAQAQVFLLVSQRAAGTYVQRDRSWIKEQIAYQLQNEAGR